MATSTGSSDSETIDDEFKSLLQRVDEVLAEAQESRKSAALTKKKVTIKEEIVKADKEATRPPISAPTSKMEVESAWPNTTEPAHDKKNEPTIKKENQRSISDSIPRATSKPSALETGSSRTRSNFEDATAAKINPASKGMWSNLRLSRSLEDTPVANEVDHAASKEFESLFSKSDDETSFTRMEPTAKEPESAGLKSEPTPTATEKDISVNNFESPLSKPGSSADIIKKKVTIKEEIIEANQEAFLPYVSEPLTATENVSPGLDSPVVKQQEKENWNNEVIEEDENESIHVPFGEQLEEMYGKGEGSPKLQDPSLYETRNMTYCNSTYVSKIPYHHGCEHDTDCKSSSMMSFTSRHKNVSWKDEFAKADDKLKTLQHCLQEVYQGCEECILLTTVQNRLKIIKASTLRSSFAKCHAQEKKNQKKLKEVQNLLSELNQQISRESDRQS